MCLIAFGSAIQSTSSYSVVRFFLQRGWVTLYPQGGFDADNIAISEAKLGFGYPAICKEQFFTVTWFIMSTRNPKPDEATNAPNKNEFDSGPGTSDIEIREYLRYNVYRPQAAATPDRRA